MRIDIGSCFNFGIEKLKANPTFYIVGTIILFAISFVVNLVSNLITSVLARVIGAVCSSLNLSELLAAIAGGMIGFFIGLILGLVMVPFIVGFFRGIKKEYEGGKAEIGDIFTGFDVLVPAIVNYLVSNIVVIIGFCLCIIPGILVSSLPMLSILLIVDGEKEGLNPFKKAIEILKNCPIVILWGIVLSIFSALGLIACCVGIFATVPIAACAGYKMFRQATGTEAVVEKGV